jgi:hypothetical protein
MPHQYIPHCRDGDTTIGSSGSQNSTNERIYARFDDIGAVIEIKAEYIGTVTRFAGKCRTSHYTKPLYST